MEEAEAKFLRLQVFALETIVAALLLREPEREKVLAFAERMMANRKKDERDAITGIIDHLRAMASVPDAEGYASPPA